jgi:hypothetical protein
MKIKATTINPSISPLRASNRLAPGRGHGVETTLNNAKRKKQFEGHAGCRRALWLPCTAARSANQEYESISSVKIQLRLPEDMKDAAMRQASMSGISMNLFVATAVAARVGAQSEAERYFSARGSRTTPTRAKALLSRLGTSGDLRDDDHMDAPDELA